VDGRKMILENILGTDMTKHGAILNEVKAIAALPENERLMGDKNKAYMLKALVHAADIGNPTRPFDIAKKWGVNIVKEFFHQGDKEKALGIEISFGCDRSNSNFAKSQIGFFDFMIYPYYNTLTTLIPKMEPLAAQIKINVEEYRNLVDEYEVAMKEGNLEF
jgi:cAMP-specific phosphodiesterase 4